MKNLILIILLLLSSFSYSQSLTEIYAAYIQPKNTPEEIQEGLKQVENLCNVNPQEKCNKAKATAYYLLADNFYAEAWSVYKTDSTLVQPILLKANKLYNKAFKYMPITDFTEEQKNSMLNDKNYFEALISVK